MNSESKNNEFLELILKIYEKGSKQDVKLHQLIEEIKKDLQPLVKINR
ncbi:hypothetical protein M3175_15680 [Robertmurraya korlensis]|nr:hypothetical protein [Robertmurraya korlensis]MCM3602183.1 hypothetical protein [Robertmurraya korlensis]